MNPSFRLLWLVGVLVSLAVACQNTEQSAVQPEKLASSSPSTASSAESTESGGPLVPFASGHGPSELAPQASATGDATEPDDEEFDPDGPTPAPKADATGAAPVPKPKAAPAEVKLVKAGAEPHAELRLTPKVGDAVAVEMVMSTAIKMEIDGNAPPAGKVPPIVFVMQTKVTEVSPNGDIHYDFELSDAGVRAVPGVEDKVITMLNQALGSLVGLKGEVVITSRGITKESKLSLPGKQNAQTQQVLQGMEQALQQMNAPFPAEPVGKGARWTHTNTLNQNGITLTQQSTYDLVKVSGQNITLKVGISQLAPKQKVSQMGVTVDLLSLKSSGKGTTQLRLDRLAPVKSKIKIDTKASMGLPQGQKMKMDSSLTVEMAEPSKKPAPKPTTSDGQAPAPTPAAPAPAPAPKPAPAPAPAPAP